MSDVALALKTERYHRAVFDNFYVQDYKITDEDKQTIKLYDRLFKACPNFRQICYDEYLILSHIANVNYHRLTDVEKRHLDELKLINFNRYSVKKPS